MATDSMDMSLNKLQEMVKDREAWCAVVHGDTENQTRLSNGTMMMMPLTKDAVSSLSPEISSLKWGGEREEGPLPPGQLRRILGGGGRRRGEGGGKGGGGKEGQGGVGERRGDCTPQLCPKVQAIPDSRYQWDTKKTIHLH